MSHQLRIELKKQKQKSKIKRIAKTKKEA